MVYVFEIKYESTIIHLLQKVLRKTYLLFLNYFGFVLAHLILSLQKKKVLSSCVLLQIAVWLSMQHCQRARNGKSDEFWHWMSWLAKDPIGPQKLMHGLWGAINLSEIIYFVHTCIFLGRELRALIWFSVEFRF